MSDQPAEPQEIGHVRFGLLDNGSVDIAINGIVPYVMKYGLAQVLTQMAQYEQATEMLQQRASGPTSKIVVPFPQRDS